jgi:putative tryptophan/tyrosine transport system substrate-binding protein
VRRRDFIISLCGAAVALPYIARAQQSERLKRIGVLMGIAETDSESQSRIAAFRSALRGLDWVEGRNIQVDYRWTGGDAKLAKAYAKELVSLEPAVIVCHSTPALEALQRETSTIPIVFALVADPVGGGFVANLAQPGGNITGFTIFEFSIGGKWIEILKELAPRVTRVALVFRPESAPFAEQFMRAVESVASSFAVRPVAAPARDVAELERNVAAFAAQPNGGLIIVPDAFTAVQRVPIVELAARYRVPAVYPFRYFSTLGGLVSYGIDPTEIFQRSGSYVDRILKGAKPGDLPVQVPVKFELVINLRTAKSLGLDVPPTLLARADEVIK